MIEDFYRLLFDPNQATCFSSDVKGTKVEPVRPRRDRAFFTINALDPKIDHHPTEEYHAANRPRRADHNVICLRNILIEMDHGTFKQQMSWMAASQLPWSTCVSSGGKSLHFILSLATPISDRLSYSRTVKRIYEALSAQMKIDSANKNPSRFSRCPGARREDKGTTQDLLAIHSRIENATLESWLSKNAAPALLTRESQGTLLRLPHSNRLFASTLKFLEAGAPEGEWNNQLFRAACNLFQTGDSLEVATDKFRSITGRLDASDLATIRSAFRRAVRDSNL